MEGDRIPWNMVEHPGKPWNVLEESHGMSWKVVETHGMLQNIMENSGTMPQNVMKPDSTLMKGVETCGRLWNLLEHGIGKRWKEMEGDGTVEYSRTFYAKF